MKSYLTFKKIKPIFEDKFSKVIFDNYPVTKGHILVIPKKKVISVFKLSKTQYQQVFEMVKKTVAFLKKKYKVKDFNIGINNGKYAGQTVKQAHIHIIPRYKGDVKDPAGGVRGVIPKKRKYK